ncbi:hypothetical protein PINS_up003092 [Pythium insidiosum]|nr:hypothetical protein PINS_up003092 [Pythium insidiosum]
MAPSDLDDAAAKKRAMADASAAGLAPNQAQRKKRKQEKQNALKLDNWDRCMHRIERKNRYCNLARVAGAEYCGNHLPADTVVASKRSQHFNAERRARVPCPLDPTHTVYQYDLPKHLTVCNKLREREAMTKLPFYRENINSGRHADKSETTPGRATESILSTSTEDAEETQEHSGPTQQEEQSLIDKLAAMDFADLQRRVQIAFDRCVGDIPVAKLRHSCCDALLQEKTEAGSSKNVLRHIEQQASILGHMERVNLLDPQAAFLELGAGRGMLSLALAQALPDSLFVLIDRAGNRAKADHSIREKDARSRVLRAKIDIRHLNLSGLEEIAGAPVVGMSKHLCGVATDLSLRSLLTLPTTTTMTAQQQQQPSLSESFKGIAVALCCHHVCQWADYISPEFFVAQGFTPEEFPLLASMTSWCTCAIKPEGDAVARVLGISKADRALLGRQCKRILDAGRVEFLRNYGLQAELVHYCDIEDSVENCLLLAWRANTE